MSRTTFTTIPVKPGTLRRLRAYKVGGQSYDDLLNDWMDEHPPKELVKEWLRRLREEPDIPWAKVKRRLKL